VTLPAYERKRLEGALRLLERASMQPAISSDPELSGKLDEARYLLADGMINLMQGQRDTGLDRLRGALASGESVYAPLDARMMDDAAAADAAFPVGAANFRIRSGIAELGGGQTPRPREGNPDDRKAAKRFFKRLSRAERNELGDALVLGYFDWSDWGLEREPSAAFLRALDRARMDWEIRDDNPSDDEGDAHPDVEFHVDKADGSTKIFRNFDKAAGLAVALAASTGRKAQILTIIWSREGAESYAGDWGAEQYDEDPDASIFQLIEVEAEDQGRIA
jgi:hypothetical protein